MLSVEVPMQAKELTVVDVPGKICHHTLASSSYYGQRLVNLGLDGKTAGVARAIVTLLCLNSMASARSQLVHTFRLRPSICDLEMDPRY